MKSLNGVVMDCYSHPKGGWSATVHFDSEVPVGMRLCEAPAGGWIDDAGRIKWLEWRVRDLEAQRDAAKAAPQQAAPAAEWLDKAYREGWAACRDAETIGEEAEDWAFGNSTANSRMIDMQQAAPQQEVPVVPYSIDADPQGIRATVADAITGALAFGAQGANMPPTGHWLAPFWKSARWEAIRAKPVHPSADTLYLLRRLLSNQHTLTGSEFRAELGKIVEDAHAATPPAQPAPSGDAWKDGDTAALVNELRDAAVQYRDTQQLRERIAHIVRPLAARVAPSGDAEDAARWRFAEASLTYAEFRDGDYVNTFGFTEEESKEALREAIDAARKGGNKP